MDDELKKPEGYAENKNSLTYGSSRLDPPITLIDYAKEIEKADNSIKMRVDHKLKVIVKQIKSLQDEAKKILEEAEEDMKLHNVKCSFKKVPGEILHLYIKDDGDMYFSRLSPAEKIGGSANQYLGSYKMNLDHSFERVEGDEYNDEE